MSRCRVNEAEMGLTDSIDPDAAERFGARDMAAHVVHCQ